VVIQRLQRPLGDQVAFLRQLRREFEATGAVAPSSRFLAKAMTQPSEQRQGPVRILEIGPGTGAVTRRIVELLRPDDRLDLVELNDQFATILKRKFREDHLFQTVSDRAHVHVCAVQDYESEGGYDFIISGLPLNNFSADAVREIFDVCFGLLSPTGVLSYFEYIGVRRLRRLFSGANERARLTALDAVLNEYLSGHRVQTVAVLANLPPAWVHHLQASGGAGSV
jgi:phospholipid N-methyltransferase